MFLTFRKIAFLSLLVICLQITAGAQKDSTLDQRIGVAFCTEFSKIDSSKLTADGWEMELGLMILPLFEKFSAEIEKEWNISSDDPDGMEKIGEKIGQIAALKCPAFQQFVLKNLDKLGLDEEGSEKSVEGKLIRIEQQGPFNQLIIKAKNGKDEKLWWFEFFEGADELLSKPDKFKNETLKVKYKEMDVYDALIKEYRVIRVITNLSKEKK